MIFKLNSGEKGTCIGNAITSWDFLFPFQIKLL